MKIGNVITNQNTESFPDFNVFEKYEEVDNDLPTLIIGYETVKLSFEDFKMLKRQLNRNTFWTFTLREKRDIHNEDVVKFRHHCFETIIKNITYIYIDPFNWPLGNIKKTIRRIQNPEYELISYRHENMIYILSDKIIFGINLDVLDFMEISVSRLIDKIKQHSIVFLKGDKILIEYVNEMEYLNNEVKYIPLLYSITNEK
jgi:hypothetical protein